MDSALDSIIDAIENNMQKQALALCEKYLKKWPGNVQISSLKSLALWYSGLEKEAKNLASFVTQKQPKDHFTISVIDKVLEYMDDFDSIAILCENALKHDYDIRIAEKLYFAYLKLQSTKKLYAVASKLYNVSKNQVYLYWAIVGLILESRCQGNENNSVIPELAKRILQKIYFPFFNDKLDTEYKFLSVIVCELASDHSGLLKALDLKTKIDPSEYTILKIKANQYLNNFEEAKAKSIAYLESSSFIDSSIWLSFLNILDKIDDGITLAKNLLESFETKGDLRGYKIAALEFKIVYHEAFSESVAEMLFNFTVDIRSKPSTFNDVIYFLKKMESQDINSFYGMITNYINSTESINDITTKALYLHLHRYISSISSSNLLINDRIQKNLKEFYKELVFLKGDTDGYYSLALYHCLCEIDSCYSNTNGNFSNLIELLEKYSLIFPDNYVFGILLVCSNLKFGLFKSSQKIFKSLEIKCLQLDTLGYLISDHALNFLAFSEFESFCNESSSLYGSNRRDTWGLICQSLETQSFVSALDFCEFYNRLERSIQHICIETNYVKMNILKLPLNDLIGVFSSERMSKSHKILSYASEHYIDNRDFKIFDTIDVTENLKNTIKGLSEFKINEALYYLSLFNFILSYSRPNLIDGNRDDIKLTDSRYKEMKKIFDSSCEKDLTINITHFANGLEEPMISKMENYQKTFVEYKHFELVSKFLITFKELLLISVLKLKEFKITNIYSHSVIVFLKAKLASIESSISNFVESLENVNDEHMTNFKNMLIMVSNLSNDALLLK